MATILSVANMKGGVGKTTLCVSLAEGLCYMSKHVLVVDLDPQTNCSQVLWGLRREDPWKDGENICEFLKRALSSGNVDPFPYIKRHIILNGGRTGSASLFLRLSFAVLLRAAKAFGIQERHQATGSDLQKGDRQIVRPGDSRISITSFSTVRRASRCSPEAALTSSDMIIIPTAPNFLSTMGIEAFSDFLVKETKAQRYVFINQVHNTARSMAKFRREIWDETKLPEPRFGVFREFTTISASASSARWSATTARPSKSAMATSASWSRTWSRN